MSEETKDLLEQIDRHLASPCQAWLFGAGISKEAGIPLMHPLTSRVRALALASDHKTVFETIFADLPKTAHVEHFLSHLGDYAAIADRTGASEVPIRGATIKTKALIEVHRDVSRWIAETVRWGYRPPPAAGQPEQIGKYGTPIVDITEHQAFIDALFKTNQAGLYDRRGPVRLFSTNYDTLLEDALSLCGVTCWDGFSGGAVAFRNYHFGEQEPSTGYRAHVVKLHGSIDWHLGDDGRVRRVRDGDAYPRTRGRVLIYPQATKYMATQRDPFAAQFDLLRRTLSTAEDNVLTVCGYSFGDEHINQELDIAMSAPASRTTMLVFVNERDGLAECLKKWRSSAWGKRLYIMTEKGLYVGNTGPFHSPEAGKERNWWTFSGLTNVLTNGAESYS